ncbi:MAG: tetratricopeptide repeat protein [Anaerolineae bacterium]|nr:tetratricopeptide repeat protein [Anaerolineae bacterium]
MSKRSSRRKRKQSQQKLQKPAVLIPQGLNAFRQADYDEAIKAWDLVISKPNTPANLPGALAEAYFRRAVTAPAPQLADLQKATTLKPNDPRYRYHLALAYHRQGQLSQAEPLYRQLLAESPPFERAAVPLAQLLIEQKKAVTKEPFWEQIPPEIQTQLAAAEALVKRKADSTLRQLVEEPLEPLWAGLIRIALGDEANAQPLLQQVLANGRQQHALLRGVAHYYLGAIAANTNGQTEAMVKHWSAARADGVDSPHLTENLSNLAYEQAIAARQAQQPERAAELLEQVQTSRSDIREFQSQLNWDLGYAAAQKEKWPQALSYWQKAEQSGNDSRRLIYNLALAYQRSERFLEAAEYWRTLLRRRPRKADHPDALTDAQVARIWQNVADNYSRAEDFEEAIKTYKNAVKWAPDNTGLRLKLVEALQNEGRWQAAENELNRILEKEPDNIPAMTLLAESYGDAYYYAPAARKLWLRILELEPQNPVARQQLAHSFETEGYNMSMWGRDEQAIEIYKEGLKHVPDSPRLLIMIGGTYADIHNFKQARTYIEQACAINPNDLQTLHTAYRIWLEHGSKKDVNRTFEQIKAVTVPIPGSFFIDLYLYALDFDQEDTALEILKYAETRYSDDLDVLTSIAVEYSNMDDTKRAQALLRRVLKENPDHAMANLQLGVLYYEMDQTRLAKRHWQTAETQARKDNNQMLLHQIKLIKDELLYGKRAPTNPVDMLFSMPPELREELIKTAPPEIAEMLRNASPEMLKQMFNFGGFSDFDDEFDDEDAFFL